MNAESSTNRFHAGLLRCFNLRFHFSVTVIQTEDFYLALKVEARIHSGKSALTSGWIL
jgi:predicted DNA-binding protein